MDCRSIFLRTSKELVFKLLIDLFNTAEDDQYTHSLIIKK
jgi:hypothetical protein